MKIIDILNKVSNGTLEDGFTFKYDGDTYWYDKKLNKIKNEVTCANIGDEYIIENILNDEVEVIEEKEEIKEIEITEKNRRTIIDFVIKTAEKTNELVRELNKLTKEREEK